MPRRFGLDEWKRKWRKLVMKRKEFRTLVTSWLQRWSKTHPMTMLIDECFVKEREFWLGWAKYLAFVLAATVERSVCNVGVL